MPMLICNFGFLLFGNFFGSASRVLRTAASGINIFQFKFVLQFEIGRGQKYYYLFEMLILVNFHIFYLKSLKHT